MLSANPQVIASFKRRFGIGLKRGVNHRPNSRFTHKRSYPAASSDRLVADWTPASATGDAEIRFDIQSLRDRSRQLERADPLMKRFLSCLEKNVLKSGVGYTLQSKVVQPDGKPDFMANQKIEAAWKDWTRKKYCTENGEESLYEVCRLVLRSAARDGGAMLQKVMTDPEENRYGFALRLIEIDHLDVNYNAIRQNGNHIVMGVEKTERGRTVAYWLLNKHPGDLLFGASPYSRERVPADQIIHYFLKERITQCVGVPWAAPSMLRMHHLEQYEISEIIASRAAANKGGYFTSERGDNYAGENEQATAADGTTQDTGATLAQSEPGQSDELPPGMSFVPYDPTHPTQQYGDFTRDAKLGISTGLDMSYATLVGDLTKSSFSSMRTGWLDERETYMKMQAHMVEHLMLEIFEAWLETQLTLQTIKLPLSKFDAFNKPMFIGRRWPWIDPQKDVMSSLMETNGGLKTKQQIIESSDSDLDLEETFEQLAYEKKLAEKHGLEFANPNTGGSTSAPKEEKEKTKPKGEDPEDEEE